MTNTPRLLDAIRTRRSIRHFETDRALPPEAVQLIMEAGLRAPSSRNGHSTQFVLIEDRETLLQLSYMREEGCDPLRQAPLGVVVLGSPMECESWIADASLSAGYMQLEAWELGIGSCWCAAHGQFTGNGQNAEEYVRNVLDIPYQLEVLCILAFGYPREMVPERPLEELRWEQIHLGRYQLEGASTES